MGHDSTPPAAAVNRTTTRVPCLGPCRIRDPHRATWPGRGCPRGRSGRPALWPARSRRRCRRSRVPAVSSLRASRTSTSVARACFRHCRATPGRCGTEDAASRRERRDPAVQRRTSRQPMIGAELLDQPLKAAHEAAVVDRDGRQRRGSVRGPRRYFPAEAAGRRSIVLLAAPAEANVGLTAGPFEQHGGRGQVLHDAVVNFVAQELPVALGKVESLAQAAASRPAAIRQR